MLPGLTTRKPASDLDDAVRFLLIGTKDPTLSAPTLMAVSAGIHGDELA